MYADKQLDSAVVWMVDGYWMGREMGIKSCKSRQQQDDNTCRQRRANAEQRGISEISFSSHQTPATLPSVYLPQRYPYFIFSFDHILYSVSSI